MILLETPIKSAILKQLNGQSQASPSSGASFRHLTLSEMFPLLKVRG
jgi:hypothetical protein